MHQKATDELFVERCGRITVFQTHGNIRVFSFPVRSISGLQL